MRIVISSEFCFMEKMLRLHALLEPFSFADG